MGETVFLKLGGSLITDKHAVSTARMDVLARLAEEIHAARVANPTLRLVLGHGSGSFGHVPAARHGTRSGAHTPQDWQGFAEVWREARALNQIVVEAMAAAGLPVIALPPSAATIARDGLVHRWETSPLRSALDHGLIPVINGDTIFDEVRGGTILSTEELFFALAKVEPPKRILLAGREDGVWEDFPACTRLIREITPDGYAQVAASLGGSAATDVTGGMLKKVQSMLGLVTQSPGLEVLIFSGSTAGLVQQALTGADPGTRIHL